MLGSPYLAPCCTMHTCGQGLMLFMPAGRALAPAPKSLTHGIRCLHVALVCLLVAHGPCRGQRLLQLSQAAGEDLQRRVRAA